MRLGPGACWRVAGAPLYWFAACVFDSRISSLSLHGHYNLLVRDSRARKSTMQPRSAAAATCVIIIIALYGLQVEVSLFASSLCCTVGIVSSSFVRVSAASIFGLKGT